MSAPGAARVRLDDLLTQKVAEYNKQVHGIERKAYSALVAKLVGTK